eukprot:1404268-Karenia_brevis.AAC.1
MVRARPQDVMHYGVPLPRRWAELGIRIQKGQERAKEITEDANGLEQGALRAAGLPHWLTTDPKIQCEYLGDFKPAAVWRDGLGAFGNGPESEDVISTRGWKAAFTGGRKDYYYDDRSWRCNRLKYVFRWRARHGNGIVNRIVEDFTETTHEDIFFRQGPRMRTPPRIAPIIQKFEDIAMKARAAARKATLKLCDDDVSCEYLGQPIVAALDEQQQVPVYIQDPRWWQ